MLGLNDSRWSRVTMRGLAATIVSCVLTLAGAMATADAARRVQFNIEAQALSTALAQFSDQAGLQFTAPGASLSEVKSTGVRGEYSTGDALGVLLAGTGFTYRFVDEGTVAIREVGERKSADGGTEKGVRVAQAEGSSGQNSEKQQESAGAVEESQGAKLEEVVVTAQKRVERLQDVPVPVTVISAESLVNSNLFSFREYYSRVPGINMRTGDRGETFISIRGLTTGRYSGPVVGAVVDDVPFGSSTNIGGGEQVPDIDPSDLERIEVLRGPQGTLYGASALGGLIKYVTVDPSIETLSGTVQAGVSATTNGATLGHKLRGSLNLPLGKDMAIRASGFTRHDPGYIDDPIQNELGINRKDVEGGRLAALWQISEDLSLKVSSLFQDSTSFGGSEAVLQDLGDIGTFEQGHQLRDTGLYERKKQAHSAVVKAKLGNAAVTALSGYGKDEAVGTADFGGGGNEFAEELNNEKFSQEVRVVIPFGERFDWLLGAFYADESGNRFQRIDTYDTTTRQRTGTVITLDHLIDYTEYAAFSNLTIHFTDRFSLQLGGRQSRNKQVFDSVLNGGDGPRIDSKEDAFTYLVTPQFKVSPDLMVYARVASGYRAGGPNTVIFAQDVGQVPQVFEPDTTKNFELGAKGNFFGGGLYVDTSVYFIDWSDIQLQFFTGQHSFTQNAGQATSKGVDLTLEFRPLAGLKIGGWVAYNDAQLTQDFPTFAGTQKKGDQLPSSSKYSGNFYVEQEFSLTDQVSGSIGVTEIYVGERGALIGSQGPANFPAYWTTDLRAGLQFESWKIDFFLNNVADKRGVDSIGTSFYAPLVVVYNQPRTVGISLSKNF